MRQGPLFSNIKTGEAYYDSDCATYKGICAKTFFLLAITVLITAITAFYLPTIIEAGNFNIFYISLVISSIIGFIAVIVGRVSDRFAKYASVIYSACEGLFLGCLTVIAESLYPGASTVAIFSTLIIFVIMLTLFSTGILRVGSGFRKFAFGFSLGAIALILFISIFSLFVPLSAYFGVLILIELFLLIYGVITLSLNFAEAQGVVERGASKGSEWSVALGIMVSLIYIYVEIIRLIIIFAARRD